MAQSAIDQHIGGATATPTSPYRHDRSRPPARHLGYSLGIHYCLGAPLASLEMEVLLHTVLRRVASLRPLRDDPPYKPNLIVRGLAALPVAFGGR